MFQTVCSDVPGYHLAGPSLQNVQKKADLCVPAWKDAEPEEGPVVEKYGDCGFLFVSVVSHHFLHDPCDVSHHSSPVKRRRAVSTSCGTRSGAVGCGIVGENTLWRA